MIHWQQVPFVRLLIPFVIGILIADSSEFSLRNTSLFLVLGFFLLTLLLRLAYKGISFQHKTHFGILLFIKMILLGILLFQYQHPAMHQHHYLNSEAGMEFFLIKIDKVKKSGRKGKQRAYAKIIALGTTSDSLYQSRGKVLCYFNQQKIFTLEAPL